MHCCVYCWTGSCACLTPPASHALWELHLLFFSLANYSPDEAAAMLARDIGAIQFPAYVVAPVLANLCIPERDQSQHGLNLSDSEEAIDGSGVPSIAAGATSSAGSAIVLSRSPMLDVTQQVSCDKASTGFAESGTSIETRTPISSLQLLRRHFDELSAAVQHSNSLEWAVVHGDSEQAYQAMHEAATRLLSVTETAPNLICAAVARGASAEPAKGKISCDTNACDGCLALAKLLASKVKEWRVRVVICAVHLLERDRRWDDALHYLEILLGISNQQHHALATNTDVVTVKHSRVAAHQRGSVWVRYGIDLEHQNRYEQALKAYEQALSDPAVCGEWRVACARAYTKLWKPPRRWGSVRNCPSFATCSTFTLRGKRLPKVEDRFGRTSGGGWLPIRYAPSIQPCGKEIDDSTVDGVWLQAATCGTDGCSECAIATATVAVVPAAAAAPPAPPAPCSRSNCTEVAVSSVEEFVRRHYLQQGFEGYHCENRLFLTLFGLLMWDVVHGPVESVVVKRQGGDSPGPDDDKNETTNEDCEHIDSLPFTSAYQDTPHDLHHGVDFISRRRAAIDAALQDIESGSGAEQRLRASFEAHYGEQSRYVQWDWRDAQLVRQRNSESEGNGGQANGAGGGGESEASMLGINTDINTACEEQAERDREDLSSKAVALEELVGLCHGLGSYAVAGMCRLYAESYDTWAGGLPDLLVWRRHQLPRIDFQTPTDGINRTVGHVGNLPISIHSSADSVENHVGSARWEVRLVEVKGPGDSLSHRQRAWIDRLVGWGVSVCVCHVIAVDTES